MGKKGFRGQVAEDSELAKPIRLPVRLRARIKAGRVAVEPLGIEVSDAADDEFRVVVFRQKIQFAEQLDGCQHGLQDLV